MTQQQKSPYIDFIIEFIKEELLQGNFKEEIVRPLLIYILHYIIPIIILIVVLNFLATILGVFMVLYISKSYH